MASDPQIHHFGRIVENIDEYIARAPWPVVGSPVVDPAQQARLALVSVGRASPFIEIIEPLGDGSPLWSALHRGGGWHHVCLAVGTRERGDRLLADGGFLPVTAWTPAVLFGGRLVRFTYSRNRELVELFADEDGG